MKSLNNAEKIATFLATNGKQSLDINPIPRTDLWLVGEKKKNKWTVLLCNPHLTSHRLVTTKPIEHNEYADLWLKLIALPITGTQPKELLTEYRKTVTNYYKNLHKTQ